MNGKRREVITRSLIGGERLRVGQEVDREQHGDQGGGQGVGGEATSYKGVSYL